MTNRINDNRPAHEWIIRDGKRVRAGWRKCMNCNPKGDIVGPRPLTCTCTAGWRQYIIRRGTKLNGFHSTRHL